ncbi:hypothetical protein [Flavobacterium sp.]|uniref:hypothetical protein n=1 Tax=Flavobacterium sp. TaxID=239 RepID=UPI003D12CA2A
MAGNDLEAKGTPYAGDIGYYTGEAIDISSNLAAGFYKLTAKGSSLFTRYRGAAKISKNFTEAVNLSAQASYDVFVADANSKISDITSLKAKIEFIETETGVDIISYFEASNNKGDRIEQTNKTTVKYPENKGGTTTVNDNKIEDKQTELKN